MLNQRRELKETALRQGDNPKPLKGDEGGSLRDNFFEGQCLVKGGKSLKKLHRTGTTPNP
ncbi:hypothetical protein BhenCHDE101_07355 [Bartonella henselae]|nr:hypothetical protein BhenCHDE101_07355 [Bartonella henselae]OLL44626.1 hypothetical protein AT242_07920 [Bartonella henselae]PNM38973.1 hypothetical protein AL470_006670 [Bartonella henselae str. Houston-1]